MPFREDIIRGVRLSAITFAAILLCIAAYRILKAPSNVQGAAQEVSAPPPAPAPDAVPSSDDDADTHPLVVPEPPPIVGAGAPHRGPRAVDPGVPPPPPIRAQRTPAPSGRPVESSRVVVVPAVTAAESTEPAPVTPPQTGVGYKSLIEANANRIPDEITPAAPAADSSEKQAKGNRFFRAIGKLFHPGGKKETTPLALQPKQP